MKRYAVNSGAYSFCVSERVSDNNQVVRTYNRSSLKSNDVALCSTMERETEIETSQAILMALGIDEAYIASLSDDELLEDTSCEQITTTVMHIKNDENGNTAYLSEQEALSEVAALSQKPEDVFDVRETTEYLAVTHSVYYYGEALYRFMTFARWLTMPVWRLTDSIGSCAQNVSIVYGSASGEYGFEYTYIDHALGTTITDSDVCQISNIHQAEPTGVWDGMVGSFNLPVDANNGYSSYRYYNFWASFEYKAVLSSPNEVRNFNSVGCYCHHKILPVISPSASIEQGKTTMSIGISLGLTNEIVSAGMLLNYIPG